MSDQTDMNRGFLKDKLGNYQVDPPGEVWDEISERIGGGRNRRRIFLLLLASAASIALAISLGIHFLGPDMPRQKTLSQETVDSGRDQTIVEPMAKEPRVSAVVPQEDNQISGQAEVEIKPDDEEQTQEKNLGTVSQHKDLAVNQDQAPQELTPQDQAPQELTPQLQEITPQVQAQRELNPRAQELTIDPYAYDRPEEEMVPESDTLIKLLPEIPGENDALAADIMDEAAKSEPRWTLGAALSPLYSYRDAEASAFPDNRTESGLLSYSTGVHLSYRRNSRLAFETGIYFNKTGLAIGAPGIQVFSQSFDNMVFGTGSEKTEIKTINNSVGNIVAYSGDIYVNGYKISAENGAKADASAFLNEKTTTESGIQQHLDFLELPFNLRYSIIDRTFELQLVGGMSTNFLLNNYVTMETSSGQQEIGYLSNIKTVNYSGNAGIGMIYHMGGKLSLLLEPRFRYFINSVNDSTLPSTRPYSLGFYTGLSYTF